MLDHEMLMQYDLSWHYVLNLTVGFPEATKKMLSGSHERSDWISTWNGASEISKNCHVQRKQHPRGATSRYLLLLILSARYCWKTWRSCWLLLNVTSNLLFCGEVSKSHYLHIIK